MYIAFPATVIYAIIIAFSLIGRGATDGLETDFSGDLEIEDGESTGSIQVFTVRNLLAFLVGLGWAGLSALDAGHTDLMAIIIGIGVGSAFVVVQVALFYFMSKLSQPNEPSIQSALGEMGTVYLTVPAQKQGIGKVTVVIDGTVRTLSAITHGEELKTGSLIRVDSIAGDAVVVSNVIE